MRVRHALLQRIALSRDFKSRSNSKRKDAFDRRGPAHVLFELAHAKFDGARIADPAFEVLTGFHVIDGVTRLILVEGTVGDVMDPIFEIAAREASNPAARVLFNRRLGYDARAYGNLGGDIWPVKPAEIGRAHV